ncbi:MAG TPA: CCA tRNA nucleotidyltransferase, partial [Lachnospiraceae bacterium]|nr:CCA tRNA nucleotidyltransferase [Lachnospiraceae bacterium]
MHITLPDKVRLIIQKLTDEGFEAYAVGGCVRDCLLGKKPNDWDITTSATPIQVKSLFRRTIDTGIQHGTVTIMLGNEGYEVTTYRIDGTYDDLRHPKDVTFTVSLEEDLKRRDFTINAMAYNYDSGLVDLFGGLDDLDKGIIRAVGDPYDRFSEDALRILRAVRFAAQLDYDIDKKTLEAVKSLAPNLTRISAERVRTELQKLLVSKHPERIFTLYET